MQTYTHYKESGIDWIGQIPEHWEVKKITHLFSKVGSGTTPTAGLAQYYENGSINFLQTGDLNDNLITNTSKKITENALKDCSSLKIYPKGSLVIAMYGATIGKLGILDIETTTNQACCVLGDNKSNVEIKYIFYWFSFAKKQIISMSYGGGQPNISQDLIKSLRLNFPPIHEQEAIANFLDEKTAKIDALVQTKEQQIEKLKELRQAKIHQAVTKGIPCHAEPVEASSKTHALSKVEMKDSGIEWIGQIPEHWEVKRLKNVGEFINGYAFNSESFLSEGIKVMKISNIQTMKTDWSDLSCVDVKYFEALEKFRVLQGDLVFALTRPIISTGIKATIVFENEKILINQRNAILRTKGDFDIKWLYYIILDSSFIQEFDNQIDKTGQQPNISTYNIGNISIPFPRKKDIEQIVTYLDEVTGKIDQAIAQKQEQITKLKEYKQSLINDVVTGKIKVC